MKILNKLSIKSIKLNKKRTISTIIGIILSCSLICAVATLGTSFQETLIQNAINESGYYHLRISNTNNDDLEKLKNNRDIKEIFNILENGYGILENSKNEYKPYIKVYSMDKEEFEKLSFKLLEGRFANNENEIVISNHISTNGKVDYKIGDRIKVKLGERKTLDGFELKYTNSYNKDDEQLINLSSEKEFTIVGIIERPQNTFEGYSDPGYTTITTNFNNGKAHTYISLKSPRNYKTSILEILGGTDYNAIVNHTSLSGNLNYEEYSINQELLRWEAFAFSDDTVLMLYSAITIVIFIIMLTSIFCIRNSFAIATTEKMKMYGMLVSVGATKKQIKKNVIFESIILGIIGIPIGIISGILAIYIVLNIVNQIAGDRFFGNIDGLVMKVSITPIILSMILSVITIYFSALSSARKASKVSPIDLIRNSEEIKLKARKLKVPFIISKLFKTGGILAYKNLKRSKKKYRTTVVSISISIFIFITMNAFIANMFDYSSNYYKEIDYNIRINCNGENQEVVDKITKLNYIDEYTVIYNTDNNIKIYDLSKINESETYPLTEETIFDEQQGAYVISGEGKSARLSIIGLQDEAFRRYAKKIGANYDKIKDKGILVDDYIEYEENSTKQIRQRRYEYKENDEIVGKMAGEEMKVTVGKITDIRPSSYENTFYPDGYLILNMEYFKDKIQFNPLRITIQSSNTEELEKIFEKEKFGVIITNIEEEVREEKSISLIIKIFLYGFIAVITLIGITNIFNTITSNMELRQKEFAMLKSIGMTKKEFNRMINLETIFYSTKSLIYGIIMGLLGTFAMYKAFSLKFVAGETYIPTDAIVISVIAVFILIFVIMKYSISKINKQNIIDTIRNENI